MYRCLDKRCTGKTTKLLSYARNLAIYHPDKTILFVCSNPFHMIDIYYEQGINLKDVTNITFINYKCLTKEHILSKKFIIVVDELDYLLEKFNIEGYTNTIELEIK